MTSTPYYVYAFDQYTSTILRNCLSAEQGTPTRFTRYVRSTQWNILRRRQAMYDWISIALTLLKLAETLVLWRCGSLTLGLLTAVNWAWFLLGAAIIQLVGLSREHSRYFEANDPDSYSEKPSADKASMISSHGYCYDYLSGDLPSVQSIGQHRKVIFNVPPNVRDHILWRFVWTGGALICIACLVGTYAMIGSQPPRATAVWLGFQTFWLAFRSCFFYVARETEGLQHGVPKLVRTHELGRFGYRILCLASVVSRHQVQLHPRMPYSYTQDTQDPAEVLDTMRTAVLLFDRSQISLDLSIEQANGGQLTTEVEVKGVIGDTLLASIAWIVGSPHTSMDLYDCCLVSLRVGSRIVLIPSVRVLSGHVNEVRQSRGDLEAGIVGEHTPQGVVNDGVGIGWVFWVPLDARRWMYLVADLNFLGRQRMEVLTPEEVSRRLALGNLFVSLRDVKDVENTLEKSRAVGQLLGDLVRVENQFETK